MSAHNPVNNPVHYNSHPSGIEAIEVCEHMTFCVGNATKYLWRAGLKGDAVEDLEKSIWYIRREIERRKGEQSDVPVAKENGRPPSSPVDIRSYE